MPADLGLGRDGPVRILREDLVLVDWGPMTLTIAAWRCGRPRPVIAARAAREALSVLAELADFQHYLKRTADRLPAGRLLPPVVERARRAALIAPTELTPLAAVAGAVADQVAEVAQALGADRVIVNNGGDIALRLTGRAQATVGIRPPAQPGEPPPPLMARLRVRAGQGVGGVATSGWSGRSFSLGVADLVTVWAAEAALADAAATHIAGRTDVASPAVRRAPAKSLDPASDLGQRLVVTAVGALNRDERATALAAGQTAALDLCAAGRIKGCLIAVQGEMALLDPHQRLLFASAR